MGGEFRMAGGSVMGREHYRLRGNKQDAFRIEKCGDVQVAVVCDGCGDSGSVASEVGAGIGARMIAHRLATVFAAEPCRLESAERVEETLEEVRKRTLSDLKKLVKAMGADSREVICECFLFTVVGCVIGNEHATFFSIGDGVIVVNGEIKVIGPFADNAPPYLAYGLVSEDKEQEDVKFVLHRHMATTELENFMLGSDGVGDLIEQAEGYVPGTQAKIGGIEQFWEGEHYYVNPFALPNRLRLINTDQVKISWEERRKTVEMGKLGDDTTVVVGRR